MKVIVIGAGLSGLSTALFLAKRGLNVVVVEKRSLTELLQSSKLSSKNLSMDLSARGVLALNQLGLMTTIVTQSIPMKEKVFHLPNHEPIKVPYGKSEQEYILTVSRSFLFKSLFEKARSSSKILFYFSCFLENIDFEKRTIKLKHSNIYKENLHYDLLVGTDGVHSKVRELLPQNIFVKEKLDLGYKEIFIPKLPKNRYAFEAMHIWPRNGFMLMGQPNLDGSFTCALIMRKNSDTLGFNHINSKNIEDFFSEYFPEAKNAIPHLPSQYSERPLGNFHNIFSKKICFFNSVVLLGDSVHAMVPFLGQGVNCCFEDSRVLYECLKKYNNRLKPALKDFNEQRVENINAIVRLSLENYPEMKKDFSIKQEILKKNLDILLMQKFPQYRSCHNLICFDNDNYSYIEKLKQKQMLLIDNLARNNSSFLKVNHRLAKIEMGNYLAAISTKGLF